MVAAREGGEACVCDLTEPLGLTQPTISHHLKILVEAGIFTRDKRGVWAYYSLVPAALSALPAVLQPASAQHQPQVTQSVRVVMPIWASRRSPGCGGGCR